MPATKAVGETGWRDEQARKGRGCLGVVVMFVAPWVALGLVRMLGCGPT